MISRYGFSSGGFNSGKVHSRILAVLLMISTAAWAGQGVENIVIVALSPLDKSAVVRLPDQGMQVLKPGDAIRGTELSLTQVLTDKLVLEESADVTGASRVIWLHKAVNGFSAVEYPEIPKQ